MPRRKLKKSIDSDTKCENLLSIGNSFQKESSSLEVHSSGSSAIVKNEKTSNDSEKDEKAVSEVSSYLPEVTEDGKCDGVISGLEKNESSESFLQEVRGNDNAEGMNTTDSTSTVAFPVMCVDENAALQEESPEVIWLDSEEADHATKNKSVCEQISFTVKSSHSENEARQDKLSGITSLPLDSTLATNSTIKEDVVCRSELFDAEASHDESIKHQEKTSDDAVLSSDCASADSKIQEIKKVPEDEEEKMLQVPLNLSSSDKSHSLNVVESNSTEVRPKCSSSTSSLGTHNDSQSQISPEKGSVITEVPFKHITDASAGENKRKRTNTPSTVASAKAFQKTDKSSDLKRGTKSEQTTENKFELSLENTSEKGISSAGSSFEAKEVNIGSGNRSREISHQAILAARVSSTCNPEKVEFVTRSKCLMEVSPKLRKRSSSENVASGSSEKVFEAIPSKRVQTLPEDLASSTHELKSSPGVQQTSTRSLRPRKNKSNFVKTTDENNLPCTVTSVTESITEYLGEAALWVTRDIDLHPMKGSTTNKSKMYETQVYMPTSTGKSNMIVTPQTQSEREYSEVNEDSPTDEKPIQHMNVSSTEESSIKAEHLYTVSSVLDRNLNMADIPAIKSVKSPTDTEAEHSPTVSSYENMEADIQ